MAIPDSNDPAYQLYFNESVDHTTDLSILEELYYSMIGRHNYYVLDQAGTTLNIYGEPTNAGPVYGAAVNFPFHIKLDPEQELLDKYGYSRTREAVCWFNTSILTDLSVTPKVGDRFDFAYTVRGQSVLEHFEILEISPWDFQRQTKVPYQITAAANRTHKAKKP
jgi:hypothetical protein